MGSLPLEIVARVQLPYLKLIFILPSERAEVLQYVV